MKNVAIGAVMFSLPFWVVAIGLWSGSVAVSTTNNYEQFYSKENVVVEKAELEDGWTCDKPEMTTDLLQPSGYWIGDTISCWKLETPIEEWCKENPCSR